MSRIENTQKKIDEVKELGLKNKSLMPHVKNWCKHIEVTGYISGMVAEMYNLPTRVNISCDHAEGSMEAMNFEWTAGDFIIHHCRDCKFHSEVYSKNFGATILAEYYKNQETIRCKEQKYNAKKAELKNKIDLILSHKIGSVETTELSILKLIQKLFEHEVDEKTTEEIFEAAKLSPSYFSEFSMDCLSFFYDHEVYGIKVLIATLTILKYSNALPESSLDKLTDTIKRNINIDEAVQVLDIALTNKDVKNYSHLISKIISNLWYKRNIGDAYDLKITYPNVINFLVRVYNETSELVTSELVKRLKVNDKIVRINTNYLIQELILKNSSIVISLIELIIKSLELDDDDYEESADWLTCRTLGEFFKVNPQLVTIQIKKQYSTLSVGAKVEVINLYKLLVTENEYDRYHKDASKEEIIELLFDILNTKHLSKELKVAIIEATDYLSREIPLLLIGKLDVLIGVLISLLQELDTFLHYKKELDKPQSQISTFNPLVGKISWDIINDEQTLQNHIRNIKSSISHIISSDNSKTYMKVITVLKELRSDLDGTLKSHLIEILKNSINSQLILSEFLPTIYNYILDVDSKPVRIEGLNFIIHLIEKYDVLITQTIIELIKVFMKDPDIGIRGKALIAYGALTKKFPEQIFDEDIELVIEYVTDRYVYIHKQAAKLSYKIYPFLNENHKVTLIIGLLSLEDYYFKEKDYSYCSELLNMLLYITKDIQTTFNAIVRNHIPRLCRNGSEYERLDILKKLYSITKEFKGYDELCLNECLEYLLSTNPDVRSMTSESRFELYDNFYTLSLASITNIGDTLYAFAKKIIDRNSFYDLFNLFSVLAYFNFHKLIVDLSEYYEENKSKFKSSKYVEENILEYKCISDVELAVKNSVLTKEFLEKLV